VGSAWSGPVTYAYPGTKALIYDVNGNGQAVGRWDGLSNGVVWDSPTSYSTLNGLPEAINGAGSVVVGAVNGQPAYWVRNPSTQAWNTTGIPLPHISGSSCNGVITAKDVNDGGVIVGNSCNQSARQATVWQLDMSGTTPLLSGGAIGLPGLGVKGGDKSSAVAVSTIAPYYVAGTASPNGQNLVVRWVVP
jgi:hypothetical protein